MKLKNLHVVFPKGYIDVLLPMLKNEGYNVLNYDDNTGSFVDWANSDAETLADTALIIEPLTRNVPTEIEMQELLGKLTELRIKRAELRVVLILPLEASHVSNFKENLVKLGIYDFYFTENITFEIIENGIENPKNLGDMKEFIINDSSQMFLEQEVIHEVNNQEIQETDGELTRTRSARNHNKNSNNPVVVEKVVEKIVEVEKLVEVEKVIERVLTVKQKKIALHSLSKGAGSTFHTVNLAAYFNDLKINVGVFENPLDQLSKTYLADTINLFEENEQWLSIPHLIKKKQIYSRDNIPTHKGIKFYVLNSTNEKIPTYNFDEYLRYLNAGPELLKIMDFGYLDYDSYKDEGMLEVLNQFDLHILCMDLMPIAVNSEFNKLSIFLNEELNSDVQILINRFTKGISNEDMHDIGIEEALKCPMFDYETVFRSFYNQSIPYHFDADINNSLANLYDNISDLLQFDKKEMRVRKNKNKGKTKLIDRIRKLI